MLTDAEVANTARQLLSEEMCELSPHSDLLARVRARHVRKIRTKRAAIATVAVFAAAGLAAAVVAGPNRAGNEPSHRTAAGAPHSTRASGAGIQTIVLDGYTVRVAPPLTITRGRHGDLTASGFRRLRVSIMLYGGKIPAGAVRVQNWHGLAYLLSVNGKLSVYLPFPAEGQPYHSLVISSPGASRSELLRLATAIVGVAGPHSDLHSLRSRAAPAHCPCG